jgi:cobalt-zinc-cadmium efflux system outer membrane protein
MAIAGCLFAALAGCGSRLLAGSDRWVFSDGGEGPRSNRVPLATPLQANERAEAPIQQVSYQATIEAPAEPPQPFEIDSIPVENIAPGPAAPREMSIEQALMFTLDNHPRLRARAGEIEVARAELITAGLLPNPQIVLDADAPTNGEPLDFSGRLMFTFPTGFKRERAAAAAKADIVRAEWAMDAEAHILLWETADAALEVLYLQKLVALQHELTALTNEAAELSRQRVQQGIVGAADALATEINAVEIEFEGLNRSAELEIARMRLSRALGLPQPTEVSVSGALDVQPVGPQPLRELLAEAVRVRPELAAAEMAIEKSLRDAVAAQAEAIPDVELGPLFGTELASGGDSNVGVRLGMDLPWFDRKQGDIHEAMSQARVNAALRDEVQVNSLHDLANAYLQLRPIEAAVAQYEAKIVPLARQTEQLLRDPNVAQTLDPVDISDQLRKLVQIRLKHLQLRYQHNLIRTQLELLLGRRLSTGRAAEAPRPVEPQADEPRRLQVPQGEEIAPRGADWKPQRQHGQVIEEPGIEVREGETVASAAEYLDASNWRPTGKAQAARFRR